MDKIEVINIKCAEISRLDCGIIKIDYRHDYSVELEDVKEVETAFISLSNGRNIFCLMDLSKRHNNFSNEAQKFLSKEASIVKERKLKCSAVVIDNLPNRIFSRFFKTIYKPPFLMKIYPNQEDALKWLKSEVAKHGKPESIQV